MSKEVQAAVGTERQFAKQPELPYALRLNDINVSKGISQSVDYDAQRLASALGAAPKAIGVALQAIDKRKQENAKTLVNADKILMGKTKKDLQTFDAMIELQNVQGHNMSHNKYAMAILEEGMGRMASAYAKQELADMPEFQNPKSSEEAIGLYRDKLNENYKLFGDNIHNREAYDEGYFKGSQKDTIDVYREAQERINDNNRQKMLMLGSSEIQDLIYSGVTGDDFKNNVELSLRKILLSSKSPKEFTANATPLLQMLGEMDYTTDRINNMGDFDCGDGTKLRDRINLYPYYKKIAQNFDARVSDDIYTKAKRPDGTIDFNLAKKFLSELPTEFANGDGLPSQMLPIAGGDLENITPEMKGVLGCVGGALYSMGYSNAQFTSGYRDPERNASANGSPTSYHLTGNAVDIDLGVDNLSQDDKDKISSFFSQYFGEVLYHDAGSGNHLHLADYKGNMKAANYKEQSAAVYSPKRKHTIYQNLIALDNDARRIKNQKINDLVNQAYLNIPTMGQTEAVSYVQNLGLPAKKEQSIIDFINHKHKKDARIESSGTMSVQHIYWKSYEKSKAKGGYTDDARIITDWNYAMDTGKVPPSYDDFDDLQEQVDIASDRMNRYWEYSSGGAYQYSKLKDQVKKELSPEKAKDNEAKISVDSTQFAERVKVMKEWVDKNKDTYPLDKLREAVVTKGNQSQMDGEEFAKYVFDEFEN